MNTQPSPRPSTPAAVIYTAPRPGFLSVAALVLLDALAALLILSGLLLSLPVLTGAAMLLLMVLLIPHIMLARALSERTFTVTPNAIISNGEHYPFALTDCGDLPLRNNRAVLCVFGPVSSFEIVVPAAVAAWCVDAARRAKTG